ncbi:MAG: hypothetical protein MI863_20865 [Desulfobacterales bacterium]|nr:hypothetical protein [Desulfobacterales bacterium]
MMQDTSPCLLINSLQPDQYHKLINTLQLSFLETLNGGKMHYVCASVSTIFFFECNDEYHQIITTAKDGMIFCQLARLVPIEQFFAIVSMMGREDMEDKIFW